VQICCAANLQQVEVVEFGFSRANTFGLYRSLWCGRESVHGRQACGTGVIDAVWDYRKELCGYWTG